MRIAICRECGREWNVDGDELKGYCKNCFWPFVELFTGIIAIDELEDPIERTQLTVKLMNRFSSIFKYDYVDDDPDEVEDCRDGLVNDVMETPVFDFEDDNNVIGELVCDRCGREEEVYRKAGQNDDGAQMEHVANKLGFVRVKDAEGDDWDLCRVCHKYYKDITGKLNDIMTDFMNDGIDDGEYQIKVTSTCDVPEQFQNDVCHECEFFSSCVQATRRMEEYDDGCCGNCDDCDCNG